ncbi:MAG: acetyl-CoA carboxylase biotin carboxyl carrier protein [Saprospiraceae bacterium]|nr:acetyl-CoA carboxylase biotin carboxyl carrier protein [Saprospiraceae bacterium]MBK7465373.1 acetyl-CoA carboxylase biotin carboxyl carrier protein [Saprospiraceae bacterium]MBK9993512.1 acetyl-CoA carboxylase biotin carboxyl carrier protein [Saprospiraceae bacterium]
MNFKELQELIRMVSKSDLSVFKFKDAEVEVTIKTGKEPRVIEASPIAQYQIPLQQPMLAPAQSAAPAAKTESNSSANSVSTPTESPKGNYLEIKSPMVGTFYRAAGPDKPPYVQVGDSVESGKTVCMIEAMKLFNEIESEVKGTIVKVMVEDATPVEYDQVLFLVEA